MDLSTLKLSPLSQEDTDLGSPDSTRQAPREEIRWDPDSQAWAEAGFFPRVNFWEIPKAEMADDFLDQNLDLQGSHRVWENKEDVLVFLQECGFIPSREEMEAWIAWKRLLHRMEYTSEWESIDDDECVPSYIKDELSWMDLAPDAEIFEYMMFNHRLSACEIEVAPQDQETPLDEQSVSERKTQWGRRYELLGPADTATLEPLHVKKVKMKIHEVVYSEETGHLAHFLGLWDGGLTYIPKTMGSQIVKAQSAPGAKGYDWYCPEQAKGRVSCHPEKFIYVDVFQTSVENAYPWRVEWIH